MNAPIQGGAMSVLRQGEGACDPRLWFLPGVVMASPSAYV